MLAVFDAALGPDQARGVARGMLMRCKPTLIMLITGKQGVADCRSLFLSIFCEEEELARVAASTRRTLPERKDREGSIGAFQGGGEHSRFQSAHR